jgi:hypothetical protein
MRSVLALFAILPACSVASGDPMPAKSGPVILELFTSQGCSSCPPADKILAKLAANGEVAGKQVLPLSFHVDYWNDLGWADPYSQPAWTQRQHQYADALGDTRVYTPELVVGGAAGMVGSNVASITTAITSADRPALLAPATEWSKASLKITVAAPANADVLVAVFENARGNKVSRGENSGETLNHRNVVRRLERVAAAGKSGTIEIALDAKWKDVGAVVFAQRSDKKIVASAVLPHM